MKFIGIVAVLLYFLVAIPARGQKDIGQDRDDLRQFAVEFGSPNWLVFKQDARYDGASLFSEVKQAFNLSTDDEMRIVSVVTDAMGYRHYRYQQTYKGIDVEGGVYCVHEYGGRVVSANGRIVARMSGSEIPRIQRATILEEARMDMGDTTLGMDGIKLVYTLRQDTLTCMPGNFVLAYEVSADNIIAYYDAVTGSLFKSRSNIYYNDNCHDGTVNTLYNGVRTITTKLNNALYYLDDECRGGGIYTRYLGSSLYTVDNIWNNNDSKITTASAHWAAEMVYDYYLERHNRNSFDGNGTRVVVKMDDYVYLSTSCWNGNNNTILCGVGDGVTRKPLVSLDHLGHEFTHGVIQYTSNLGGIGEAGSLNESFADIFGAMVEFYVEGDNGDYFFGEDVCIGSDCIRNMKDPNLKNQPDTYQGNLWYTGDNESMRIHTNSGVQNYWFYLLAEGGEGVNDYGAPYQVQGIGKEKAARIAYWKMVYYRNSSCGYADAKIGSILAAVLLYGYNSEEVQATMDSWDAVGVNSLGSLQYNLETLPCNSYEYVHGTQELPIYVEAINRLTSKCNYVANDVPVTLFAGNEVRLVDGFYSGNNFTAAVLPLSLDGGSGRLMEGTAPRMDETVEGTSESLRESIFALSKFSKVTIYPNPAGCLVTVRTYAPIAQVCVYDIYGRQVFNNEIRADNVKSVEINAALFEPGIYLVKVDYTVGGWATDRLIINK